jgi:hypothetical protein
MLKPKSLPIYNYLFFSNIQSTLVYKQWCGEYLLSLGRQIYNKLLRHQSKHFLLKYCIREFVLKKLNAKGIR